MTQENIATERPLASAEADSAAVATLISPPLLIRVGNWIAKVNGVVLVLITIAMVVCVSWQVISRYFLETPSVITDELARFMFMWVGLLGAVQATAYKKHLAIDLMAMKLKGLHQTILTIFIEACILFFSASVMMYGGYKLTMKTFANNQITPSMQVPMGYIYMVVPIAGLLIAYFALANIITAVTHPNYRNDALGE